MKTRIQDEKEKQAAEQKELKTRLEELEDQVKEGKEELQKREARLDASLSKLRMEVEESLRKEIAANFSNTALKNPSMRDLVLIFAYQHSMLTTPRTVTFQSFLANYNNAARPGGGDGVLDLDSGIFTCFTPGYYTVSFSANGAMGPEFDHQYLYLNKNGVDLPESRWSFWTNQHGASLNDNIGVTSSRILVSNLLDMFAWKLTYVKFLQILHLDAGDSLELRMTGGEYIKQITLNIVLTGLGFDLSSW